MTDEEGRLRYRRLGYRYTMVVSSGPLSPFAWGNLRLVLAEPRWRPDADMYETVERVEVTVDLAGVAEDAFEVLLFDDALVVDGRRDLPGCEGDAVYHAAAIRQGPFRVELALPAPIDPEGVEARYERGLLRITLPKAGAPGRGA
jgi:HSP20 family protein